jgi:hypothetical protein
MATEIKEKINKLDIDIKKLNEDILKKIDDYSI